jgi:hypothetical protein
VEVGWVGGGVMAKGYNWDAVQVNDRNREFHQLLK